jgi:hypothetical protein
MTSSIRALYPFAVAEGEGVGTAYEYVAKRRVMAAALARVPRGGTILVAGLPEKYGTSLDFLLAAREAGARAVVVDDRDAALERARGAAAALGDDREITYEKVRSMRDLPRADATFSCEVLQRLGPDERRPFADALRASAPAGVIFAPNSENDAHLKISGLGGFRALELAAFFPEGSVLVGFVDMPPFPPGITRSAAQRERAKSGLAERAAMRALDLYCRAEPLVPRGIKARFAHIVYARWPA